MTISKYRTLRNSLITIITLVCFSQVSFAQYFKIKSSRRNETTAFKLIKNLIIIPVFINGKGPFNFVVDTGVGILLVTDPCLADSLNSTTNRKIEINGLGEGKVMSANIHPFEKIELGKSITGNIPLAILKEDPFDLSSFAGMPVHGLIGYELFSSFIIQINYSSKTITYHRPELEFVPRKGTLVPITIEGRKPYLETEVTFANGKKKLVKLIIDSGAGHPVSLESSNSSIPVISPEKKIQANLGIGLSGMINGFLTRIESLRLGKFKLKNVLCAFPDSSSAAVKAQAELRDGNLGNNILKRFNVVFDYERQAMYLKPNHLFNEPFEHDMSGMEITTAGTNYEHLVVTKVEPGTPAFAAGIKQGDRIVSVNFKAAQNLSLEEIHAVLHSQPGKTIIVEIQSQQSTETKYVLVKLKRRI